jgi:transposase
VELPRLRGHLISGDDVPRKEVLVAGSRRPYPEEFRKRAVQLVRSTDKSIPAIAEELGVSDQSLRNWVHQAEVDSGARRGLTTEEREELRELRRENKRLAMERDILKKAAAFFANESETR